MRLPWDQLPIRHACMSQLEGDRTPLLATIDAPSFRLSLSQVQTKRTIPGWVICTAFKTSGSSWLVHCINYQKQLHKVLWLELYYSTNPSGYIGLECHLTIPNNCVTTTIAQANDIPYSGQFGANNFKREIWLSSSAQHNWYPQATRHVHCLSESPRV